MLLFFRHNICKYLFFKSIFCAAAMLAFCQPVVLAVQTGETGIVKIKQLNMRPYPGTKNTPIMRIHKGSRFKILKHLNGWLKISYKDRIGYVRNKEKYLKIIYLKSIDKEDIAGKGGRNTGQSKTNTDGIDREIKERRARVISFTQKEADLIDSLNYVEHSLHKAGKQAAALRKELETLKKKIKAAEDERECIEKGISNLKKFSSERLAVFYKIERIGRINILASAESMYDFIQRKKALEKILEYDAYVQTKLAQERTRLHSLLADLNTKKRKTIVLEEDYERQTAIMVLKRDEKAGLLLMIKQKKSLEEAAVESLIEAAKQLDIKIKSFEEEVYHPLQVDNTAKKPFTVFKGLLKKPVKGSIISFFGEYKDLKYNVVRFRSGIDIRADKGEPVHSVYRGKVLYASWFKGYGNMIIVDHGDNYYTLYAHVEELFKAKGDNVESNEVIATAGDTGSMSGSKLHFEVRHYGKPEDPLKWIKQG